MNPSWIYLHAANIDENIMAHQLRLCTVNILSWVDYFHPASTVPWVKIIALAAQIYHYSGKKLGWTFQ